MTKRWIRWVLRSSTGAHRKDLLIPLCAPFHVFWGLFEAFPVGEPPRQRAEQGCCFTCYCTAGPSAEEPQFRRSPAIDSLKKKSHRANVPTMNQFCSILKAWPTRSSIFDPNMLHLVITAAVFIEFSLIPSDIHHKHLNFCSYSHGFTVKPPSFWPEDIVSMGKL
jgi:hypothetical protein